MASVASDIKVIIDRGSAQVMHLNVAKYELISDDMPPSIVPLDQFVHIKSDDAKLLRVLLLTGRALDLVLEKKCAELKRASERL